MNMDMDVFSLPLFLDLFWSTHIARRALTVSSDHVADHNYKDLRPLTTTRPPNLVRKR